MPIYHVVACVEYVYKVVADTPLLAAKRVEEGDSEGEGVGVDGWIDRVVLPGDGGSYDATARDLRGARAGSDIEPRGNRP